MSQMVINLPLSSPAEAAELINVGALVAFPTETVYGLGADAHNESAVLKIFNTKGRPANNPLIVHTNSIERLSEAVVLPNALAEPEIFAQTKALLKLWPGPLTIVLQKSALISSSVTNNGELVGVRIPAHPLALQFLALCNNPEAAPSANRSNYVSPTTAHHVTSEFNGVIPVLDGGACGLGIESTVVQPTVDGIIIHRPGYVTAEQIESLAGSVVEEPKIKHPVSPGQLSLHYAPKIPCYDLKDLPAGLTRVTVLGLAADIAKHVGNFPASWSVQPFDTLINYAAKLYFTFRSIDETAATGTQSPQAIAVVPPTASGLGLAITDRLTRATHR